MSELEVAALNTNFANWKRERASELSDASAFERYVIELVFKDHDLSDEEISSGMTGAGKDGGVDGFYFFVNKHLFSEENTMPERVIDAHLWIIQVKNEAGFGEMSIMKFNSFIDDLMTYSRPIPTLLFYNQKLRDLMSMFRDNYRTIITQPHEFTISFVYATRSDQAPHPDVKRRIDALEMAVKQHVSSTKFDFQLWGASRLFQAFRMPQSSTLLLDILPAYMPHKGSIVCLSRLSDFAKFLRDERGEMRHYLLEPNVRDYAGEQNPVNKEIRESLEKHHGSEF